MNKEWTKKEELELINIHKDYDNKELADYFQTTVKCIESKKHKLGVRRTFKWTKERKDLLRELYNNYTNKEIAKKMGTTEKSVQNEMSKLNLVREKIIPNKDEIKEGYKICTCCCNIFPKTYDFFGKDLKNKDGFRHRCKKCENAKKLEYRIKNKKLLNEKAKEYFKSENGKKVNKRAVIKRRSQKALNGGEYTNEQWDECLDFFEGECAYTGIKLNENNINIDHIIPISKGGTSYIWNLCPSVYFANMSKKDKDIINWYRQQPYFSKDRLSKILQWIGYASIKYKR